MAKTSQTNTRKRKKPKIEDIQVEIVKAINIDSDLDTSEDESVGIPVAEVVDEYVEPDLPIECSADEVESIKTTESTRKQAEGLIRRGRIQNGLSLIQELEEDFLEGIVRAIDQQHDPFYCLRYSFGNTDFEYVAGLDEELDARIERIKKACVIPRSFDSRGSYVLYRRIKKNPKDQRVNGIDSDES